MDCKQAQSLVIPYIQRRTDDEQAEEFLKHVFQCEECFEELEIFYTVHFALQKLDEDDRVSYDMQDMLWEHLKEAEKGIIRRKLIHYLSLGVMIAAEFFLILMLLSGAGDWRLFEAETKAASETELVTESAAETELMSESSDGESLSEKPTEGTKKE